MTRRDILQRALRMIGVVASDEPMTADQFANGSEALDILLAEITDVTFDGDSVPAASRFSLVVYLATVLSVEYGVRAPASGSAAKLKFLASVRVDDRPDARDLDDDGEVSEEEADEAVRARYY